MLASYEAKENAPTIMLFDASSAISPVAARNKYAGLCPALINFPEPSELRVNKNIVTKRLEEDFSQRNRFSRFRA